jgi:hypothetical protein
LQKIWHESGKDLVKFTKIALPNKMSLGTPLTRIAAVEVVGNQGKQVLFSED